MRTLTLLSLALACAACGHASYNVVKESGTGGIVALDGDEKEARPQAEGYMRGRCGTPGYVIEHEEAPPGAGSFRGGQTGLRITYHCNPKDPHAATSDDDESADAGSDAASAAPASSATPDGGAKKSGKSRWDR